MSSEYLREVALRNTWCDPSQDHQYIVSPERISKRTGAINLINLFYDTYRLPTDSEYYSVYQIGNLYPQYLGLPLTNDNGCPASNWFKISDSCQQTRLLVNIYTDDGIEFPKHLSYWKITANNSLLLAIKMHPKFKQTLINTDRLYFRFYSNAYFESVRSANNEKTIIIEGGTILSQTDIFHWQAKLLDYETNYNGKCLVYVNGYIQHALLTTNASNGDVVELVYDSSIKVIYSFLLNPLKTFRSEKDNIYKYILHPPFSNAELAGIENIEYYDDIDIFVTREYQTGQWKGLYYHRNSNTNCQMLTHRDYSLSVLAVQNFVSKLTEDEGDVTNQIRIRLYLRNSGYERPLLYESHKIHELYNMSSNNIKNALSGLDSTIPEWTASELEKHEYIKIMSYNNNQITLAKAVDAIGYNGISKILGNTPLKTEIYSSQKRVHLPEALRTNSTMYEYDLNGYLTGVYIHNEGEFYYTASNLTDMVEGFVGVGSHSPTMVIAQSNITVPSSDYRVYLGDKTDLDDYQNWIDVTGGSEYSIANNKISMTNPTLNTILMVRNLEGYLDYELNMPSVDGILHFTLSENEDRGDGLEHYTLPFPLGELTIFLNGRPLIDSIDYVVNFPEVVIINKLFLTNDPEYTLQNIRVRFTGFSESDLEYRNQQDVGFIEYGFFSNNNRFDLREDRVLQVISDGSLYHPSEIIFSEKHSGVSTIDSKNGKPYSIRDIVVPSKKYTTRDTYSFRRLADNLNNRISNYMTIKVPQPERTGPNAIEDQYPVISPFLTKILYDLVSEHLLLPYKNKPLSDNEILNLCKPYESWLNFDVTQNPERIDQRYIVIHPHNLNTLINITNSQFIFLTRVIQLYCSSLIQLSPYVTVTQD